jgi:hypothetical protein
MAATLLTAGLVCVIAAIIGGNLRAFGIEIPLLQSRKVRLGLGVFGGGALLAALLVAAYYPNHERRPGGEIVKCEGAPELRLNEICAEGKDCDGQKDFVEIYNPSDSSADLRCYTLADHKQHRPKKDLSGILNSKDRRAWTDDYLGFGLSRATDRVSLIRRRTDGSEHVDESRDINESQTYQQRLPDGGDEWEVMTHQEVKAAGNVGSFNGPNKSHKQRAHSGR